MMEKNEIKKFLEDNICLDKTRYNQVKETYFHIKNHISKEMNDFRVTRQGSMRTKTAIQPKNPNDEYDLDVALIKTSNNIDFIKQKDKLKNVLESKYRNVTRKSKCINIVWTRQFNGDFVIMKSNNNQQWIYDEKANTNIHSNNITLANKINEVFARTTNNAYRDANLLAKYFLRQHNKTTGILPSITLSVLVISNVANQSLEYEEIVMTTLSNLANTIYKKRNGKQLITEIPNPVGGINLKTNWKTLSDMYNFEQVISQIRQDIKSREGLKKIDFGSDIRLEYTPTSTSEKPWAKKQ